MAKIEYEGKVTLVCQEGGFADYGIVLDEMPPRYTTLSDLILRCFESKSDDFSGDKRVVPNLRITIEEI